MSDAYLLSTIEQCVHFTGELRLRISSLGSSPDCVQNRAGRERPLSQQCKSDHTDGNEYYKSKQSLHRPFRQDGCRPMRYVGQQAKPA